MKLKNDTYGIFKWIGIFCASIVYSLGIALFFSPNALAPGGASGIGIIINHLTGFGTGLLILLINIPLSIHHYDQNCLCVYFFECFKGFLWIF